MPHFMLGRTGQGWLTFLALYLTLGAIYVSTRSEWVGWALLVLLVLEIVVWLIRPRRPSSLTKLPHDS